MTRRPSILTASVSITLAVAAVCCWLVSCGVRHAAGAAGGWHDSGGAESNQVWPASNAWSWGGQITNVVTNSHGEVISNSVNEPLYLATDLWAVARSCVLTNWAYTNANTPSQDVYSTVQTQQWLSYVTGLTNTSAVFAANFTWRGVLIPNVEEVLGWVYDEESGEWYEDYVMRTNLVAINITRRLTNNATLTNLYLQPRDLLAYDCFKAMQERWAVLSTNAFPNAARPEFYSKNRDNLVAAKTWLATYLPSFVDPTKLTNGTLNDYFASFYSTSNHPAVTNVERDVYDPNQIQWVYVTPWSGYYTWGGTEFTEISETNTLLGVDMTTNREVIAAATNGVDPVTNAIPTTTNVHTTEERDVRTLILSAREAASNEVVDGVTNAWIAGTNSYWEKGTVLWKTTNVVEGSTNIVAGTTNEIPEHSNLVYWTLGYVSPAYTNWCLKGIIAPAFSNQLTRLWPERISGTVSNVLEKCMTNEPSLGWNDGRYFNNYAFTNTYGPTGEVLRVMPWGLYTNNPSPVTYTNAATTNAMTEIPRPMLTTTGLLDRLRLPPNYLTHTPWTQLNGAGIPFGRSVTNSYRFDRFTVSPATNIIAAVTNVVGGVTNIVPAATNYVMTYLSADGLVVAGPVVHWFQTTPDGLFLSFLDGTPNWPVWGTFYPGVVYKWAFTDINIAEGYTSLDYGWQGVHDILTNLYLTAATTGWNPLSTDSVNRVVQATTNRLVNGYQNWGEEIAYSNGNWSPLYSNILASLPGNAEEVADHSLAPARSFSAADLILANQYMWRIVEWIVYPDQHNSWVLGVYAVPDYALPVNYTNAVYATFVAYSNDHARTETRWPSKRVTLLGESIQSYMGSSNLVVSTGLAAAVSLYFGMVDPNRPNDPNANGEAVVVSIPPVQQASTNYDGSGALWIPFGSTNMFWPEEPHSARGTSRGWLAQPSGFLLFDWASTNGFKYR
ncbi:MAG: hypothetical protein NTV49_05415 [Kiritimatiellaeota bacterium]|nr:hypothetical protein [Kiritimatiellota bacterium]